MTQVPSYRIQVLSLYFERFCALLASVELSSFMLLQVMEENFELLSNLTRGPNWVRLKVRCSRVWNSTAQKNKEVFRINLQLLDIEGNQKNAIIPRNVLANFENTFKEDGVYEIERFSVYESENTYRVLDEEFSIFIRIDTEVRQVSDLHSSIPRYRFGFVTDDVVAFRVGRTAVLTEEFTFSSTNATKIYVDLKIAETIALLRSASDCGSGPINTIDKYFSTPPIADIKPVRATIADVLAAIQSGQCKDKKYITNVTVMKVNSATPWSYLSCNRCKKTVHKENDTFVCPKCFTSMDIAVTRYRLTTEVFDHSGSATVITFDKEAEALLKKNVYEMVDIKSKENGAMEIQEIFEQLIGLEATYEFKPTQYDIDKKSKTLTASKILITPNTATSVDQIRTPETSSVIIDNEASTQITTESKSVTKKDAKWKGKGKLDEYADGFASHHNNTTSKAGAKRRARNGIVIHDINDDDKTNGKNHVSKVIKKRHRHPPVLNTEENIRSASAKQTSQHICKEKMKKTAIIYGREDININKAIAILRKKGVYATLCPFMPLQSSPSTVSTNSSRQPANDWKWKRINNVWDIESAKIENRRLNANKLETYYQDENWSSKNKVMVCINQSTTFVEIDSWTLYKVMSNHFFTDI